MSFLNGSAKRFARSEQEASLQETPLRRSPVRIHAAAPQFPEGLIDFDADLSNLATDSGCGTFLQRGSPPPPPWRQQPESIFRNTFGSARKGEDRHGAQVSERITLNRGSGTVQSAPPRGGVAQLVRALPCHGRGYGFEPRHSRHFSRGNRKSSRHASQARRIRRHHTPRESCVFRPCVRLSKWPEGQPRLASRRNGATSSKPFLSHVTCYAASREAFPRGAQSASRHDAKAQRLQHPFPFPTSRALRRCARHSPWRAERLTPRRKGATSSTPLPLPHVACFATLREAFPVARRVPHATTQRRNVFNTPSPSPRRVLCDVARGIPRGVNNGAPA